MEISKVDFKNVNTKDLATIICQHLQDNKINVVLTGGSCVTIYSKNLYVSYDLDFVPGNINSITTIESLLKNIGFIREGRHFIRKDCPFFIEFVNPPLSIGDEKIEKVDSLRTKFGALNIISPTDCVKDRLAAYFHWDDKQSLEQAILVTKAQKINQAKIKKWAQKEGMLKKYAEYLRGMKKKRCEKKRKKWPMR